MGRISTQFPGTSFLLSCTGDSSVFATLKRNFDVFGLDCPTPYHYKGHDHQSVNHPVADLFALACCRVILGTPGSTFTHFAANALGGPSVCLLPLPRTERARPAIARMESHGWRAMNWGRVWRENTAVEMITENHRLPAPAAPDVAWARTWS